MKKVRMFLMVAALSGSLSVFAQQGKPQVIRTTKTAPQKQERVQTTKTTTVTTERSVAQDQPKVVTRTYTTTTMSAGWSSIYVQWNPSSLDPSSGDSQSFTGLTFGYNKAIPVSATLPLFVELGGAIQYSFFSETYGKGQNAVDQKFNMFSLKVPVSLVYDWQLPNSNIAIRPFAGLTLRGNLSAKQTIEDDRDKVDYNFFDKDDMGGSKATWNRFQLGWQLGANVSFNNKFYAGLSYGSDFSEIAKKVKIHTTSITLGMYLE